MEYAVRGPLVIRATEIEKELQSVRLTILFVFLSSQIVSLKVEKVARAPFDISLTQYEYTTVLNYK